MFKTFINIRFKPDTSLREIIIEKQKQTNPALDKPIGVKISPTSIL
jgi:hypothetical protein